MFEWLAAFVVVLFSEIGDKTHLALIALSAKYQRANSLFLGVLVGAVFMNGWAAIIGDTFLRSIPQSWVTAAAGFFFALYGIYALATLHSAHDEFHEYEKGESAFLAALGTTILAEMGDKTQITTALLSSRLNALFVLIGVIMAISLVSFITIRLGEKVKNANDYVVLRIISGLLFLLMGISAIFL